MRDVHIHFLHGHKKGYSEVLLEGFISVAESVGLDEIYLLEHTDQFFEFEEIYDPIRKYNDFQNNWLKERMNSSIDSYLSFIEKVNKSKYSIKVKFGLEVCYIPEKATELSFILSKYNFDFLTGSVHWIDGWGFDHKNQKYIWGKVDVNKTYKRYYEIMIELCESGLFTGLAHPDSIKCFGYNPTCDMVETYTKLAQSLINNKMYAENSGGLNLNYDKNLELGLNSKLLQTFKQYGVTIYTASDAHKQSDVGANIYELERMLGDS